MKKEAKKSISKLIQEICRISNYRNKPKQVFDDLIQLTFNILTSKTIHLRVDPYVLIQVDETLLVELSSYKKDLKSWELLKEASNEFIRLIATSEPFSDVLGGMYDEYLGDVLGQFLTPSDVATALAEICFMNSTPLEEETVMGDTCGCGAGSLMLAQLRTTYKKHGAKSLNHILMIGMDLDPKMVQLTTIQIIGNCILHQLPIKELNIHMGNVITEYNGRKDGSGTLAISWIPRFFQFQEEYEALDKIMNKFKEEELVS